MTETMTKEEQFLENYLNESKKFNIFKVLKLQDMEIRHSNFLAWLLNPNENHGLGRLFFDEFCVAAKITNLFEDFEIEREEENIDILVKDNKNKHYILIENKYGTKEHSNQLYRYSEYVKNTYSVDDNSINKIYLDIDEEKYVCSKGYTPITYENEILPILERLVSKMANNSPEQQAVYQYIAVLREKYTLRGELKNICLELQKSGNYSKYKELVDKMTNHRRFEVMDTIKNILSEKYFIPKQRNVYRVKFSIDENSYNKGLYYELDNTNTANDSEIKFFKYSDNELKTVLISTVSENEYNELFYQEYSKMKELLVIKLRQLLEKI